MNSEKNKFDDEKENDECLDYIIINENSPKFESFFLLDHQKSILWYLDYFENSQKWEKDSFNLVGSLNVNSKMQSVIFKKSDKYKIDCFKRTRICLIGTPTSSGKTRIIWEYLRSVPPGPRREFFTVGGFFHEIKFQRHAKWTIIVVPFTLKFQWLEEAKRINFDNSLLITSFDQARLQSLDLNLPYVILSTSQREQLRILSEFNCCFARVIYDEIDKENVCFLMASFTIFITATIINFFKEVLSFSPAIRNTINGVLKSATNISKLPCIICDQEFLNSKMPIIKMEKPKIKQFKLLNELDYNELRRENYKFYRNLIDANCENFLNSIFIEKFKHISNKMDKFIKTDSDHSKTSDELIKYINSKKHKKYVIVYAFKELQNYYNRGKNSNTNDFFIHNNLGIKFYCLFKSTAKAIHDSINSWRQGNGALILNLCDHIEGFNLTESEAIFFLGCNKVNKSLLIQCLGRCQRYGREESLRIYNITFGDCALPEKEWDIDNDFEKSQNDWIEWVKERKTRKRKQTEEDSSEIKRLK